MTFSKLRSLMIACLMPAALLSAPSVNAATIGYDYSVTNAQFESVSAPTFVTVPDIDGYQIIVGATSFGLLGGQQLFFSNFGLNNVTAFSLRGIDPALNLDPDDPFAFPLGITLQNVVGAISVSHDPVVAAVPLPAGALLLITALGIGFLSRRRS